jgi:S-adenosylmethionine uptake transporter
MRPAGAVGHGGHFAFGGAYAANLVLQRHQAQLAAPTEIAFFQNLFMAVCLAPLAFWLPAIPPRAVWGQVALAALFSVTSLMLGLGARAPAHRLLPLEYSAFVWAALVGWLWFGEAVGLDSAGGGFHRGGCLGGARARLGRPQGPIISSRRPVGVFFRHCCNHFAISKISAQGRESCLFTPWRP